MGMETACWRNQSNVEIEADRFLTVDVERSANAAILATSAPCSPEGFTLSGRPDANTPEGSGQAQPGAQTH